MKNLIIIPAYNEEQALPATLASLQALPASFEIVVINDGSRDGTSNAARAAARSSKLALHVIDMPVNGGIGVTVQTGYLFAAQRGGYKYAIQFDADGQHDSACLEALVAECEAQNLDLCIGSRFLEKPGEKSVDNFKSTFSRRVGIRFFSRLIGMLSGLRVTDPTSGFRCAGPRAWATFAARYPEDYPEPESLFWCARNGFRVGEIAVRMHERQGGVSSIRHFKTIYYMVKVSLAIVIDRLRKREG